MSTRSVILVTGRDGFGSPSPVTYRLYKHSDGYPSANLPILANAISRGKEQQATSAARFKDKPKPVNSDQLVGLIVGEATSVYGMGAYVELTETEEFKPEHLGNQSDVEYTYVIDTDKKTLGVYGGYGKGALKRGPIDPRPAEDNAAVDGALALLKKCGFKLLKS